ncbi:MAG: mechanosensitive ion channel [Kiritimatiellia bacterium]|jgi:small conductance mechanosensitive channel|nr:mechanosensitive ion channel [Kiritimatiellia bacterium]MDP6848757.1 mechanosensitive ion channel [Kiritimatiellia bacterium]
MNAAIAKIQGLMVSCGAQVLVAILILVIGRYAALGIRTLLVKIMKKSKVDETLISFVASLSHIAIMAFVVIAALARMGVQTTSFVAVIGAAGLAIGLALQGSLANFAAGVLLIIFKPFRVGDYIEGGGTDGVVEEIGIFVTELKSLDNKKVIVPNAKMTGDNVINHSTNEFRRVDLVAGVSYGDDLDKVRKVLEEIFDSEEKILKDPKPMVGVLELADSSVNLAVRPWVKSADYWDVFFAVQEQIKKRFDAAGISIPFPQQDVYMHTAESTA